MLKRFVALLLLCLVSSPVTYARVTAEQIAIIVNSNDPDSRKTADYYRKQRGIPEGNIIEIELPVGRNAISGETFRQVYPRVIEKTPADVQYYALAWSRPFKVGCMSVTSAFAFGYDKAFCAKGCKPTRLSAYYNSNSERPKHEQDMRPSIMLAGSSLEQVYAMIDRGVAADGSLVKGESEATAYLVSTSDRNRNVRSRRYRVIMELLADEINIEKVDSNILKDRDDVLFYFTGLKDVKAIDSNSYLPGAIADHLTSGGGRLFGGRQMSILRWLDAGVTASYGTVVEPCAFTQKFPNPGIVIERYTQGESLIEAYWKSVAWPGQGVFVGEPMAAPYADGPGHLIETDNIETDTK